MPKSNNQKLKLWFLYEILFEDAPSYETIVKVMNKCTGFDYE